MTDYPPGTRFYAEGRELTREEYEAYLKRPLRFSDYLYVFVFVTLLLAEFVIELLLYPFSLFRHENRGQDEQGRIHQEAA